MKRKIGRKFILSCLLASVLLPVLYAYGAQVLTKLGSRDLSWGTGTFVDSGGRTRYRISASDIPFAQDNAIKVGNTNLYTLSTGVLGTWKIFYSNASGAITQIAFDNSGLCLKSNGPAAAPSWGACGGGVGWYDPANVAITGGTIYGVTLGSVGSPIASLRTNGAIYIVDGATMYMQDNSIGWEHVYDAQPYDSWLSRTHSYGQYSADNVAMREILVNDQGAGSMSTSKVVYRISEGQYATRTVLFDVRASGTIVAKSGVETSVANGYRRLNICNTGGLGSLAFTPQAGDLTCVDNVYYRYANGAWSAVTQEGAESKASYTDNFNRTDENPIAAPWVTAGSANAVKVDTNQAASSSGTGAAYYDNTTANNQYSECKIPVISDGGPTVRVQSGAQNNFYGLTVVNATTAMMYKIVNDSWSQLGDTLTGTFLVTDTFRIEASGSTITAKQNGTTIGERSDATFTGGKTGVLMEGTTTRLDDWAGGDL